MADIMMLKQGGVKMIPARLLVSALITIGGCLWSKQPPFGASLGVACSVVPAPWCRLGVPARGASLSGKRLRRR
jgi:hypothetical protein